MRTGSFKLAWSKVIPLEKLVVGLSSDTGLNAVVFALRVPAKLNIVRKAPTEQKAKASKTRGLKIADWELDFFFMVGKKVFDQCCRMNFSLRESLLLVVIESQPKNGCIESPAASGAEIASILKQLFF